MHNDHVTEDEYTAEQILFRVTVKFKVLFATVLL